MKSTRITLTLVFLTLLTATYGQNTEKSTRKSMNIYEYGVPLTSCESNFKNLFNNWDSWIENHEDTKLLSYNYVETLSNRNLIEKFSNKISKVNSLETSGSHSTTETGHGQNITYSEVIRINIEPLDSFYSINDSLDQSHQNEIVSLRDSIKNGKKNRFKDIVQIGDEVYEIKFKIDQNEYTNYVVCRPEEHKVIFDDIFLGINRRIEIDK